VGVRQPLIAKAFENSARLIAAKEKNQALSCAEKLVFLLQGQQVNLGRLSLSDGWIIASRLSCARDGIQSLGLGLRKFRRVVGALFQLRVSRT